MMWSVFLRSPLEDVNKKLFIENPLLNAPNGEVYILRVDNAGNVYEDKPSDFEVARFDRHWHYDAGVISKEIAYALAKNPGLSYEGDHILIFNEKNNRWQKL